MLKLDLHIHSQYSEDGIGTPKELIKILKKKGFNGMAITDHNNIQGGLQALKIKPKDFIIIAGVEISTKDGHLIALNVNENIPRDLSIPETVENILDAGGIPIVPHLYRNMSGMKKTKLQQIVSKISAIEVFNACSLPSTNLKTMKVAKQYELGGTGGSDAHEPSFAGYGYTIVEANSMSVDSVLTELVKKRTWGEGTTIPLDIRRNRMIKSINQFFQRGLRRI